MSREIKFRAWHRLLEKMFIVTDADFYRDGSLQYVGIGDAHSTVNDFEVMQFTGLKTEKGNEIFEGDIVTTVEGVGQICYLNQSARFVIQGKGFTVDPWWAKEVIGNIYENLELLK